MATIAIPVVGEEITVAKFGSPVATEINSINAVLATITGAWTNYVPTLRQGTAANIAKNILMAKYKKVGTNCFVQGHLQPTGAGVAGNAVNITLPLNAVNTSLYTTIGMGMAYNGATVYVCTLGFQGNPAAFGFDADGLPGGGWGQQPNVAVGAGMEFRYNLVYECAP